MKYVYVFDGKYHAKAYLKHKPHEDVTTFWQRFFHIYFHLFAFSLVHIEQQSVLTSARLVKTHANLIPHVC